MPLSKKPTNSLMVRLFTGLKFYWESYDSISLVWSSFLWNVCVCMSCFFSQTFSMNADFLTTEPPTSFPRLRGLWAWRSSPNNLQSELKPCGWLIVQHLAEYCMKKLWLMNCELFLNFIIFFSKARSKCFCCRVLFECAAFVKCMASYALCSY